MRLHTTFRDQGLVRKQKTLIKNLPAATHVFLTATLQVPVSCLMVKKGASKS